MLSMGKKVCVFVTRNGVLNTAHGDEVLTRDCGILQDILSTEI